MGDEGSATLHRRQHACFLEDDREGLRALIDEESEWHITGYRSDSFGVDRRSGGAIRGDFRGLEGFFRVVDKLRDLSDGTFKLEDIAVMGDGDISTALIRVTGTRGSAALEAVAVEVIRWRDGQAVEGWFLPFDQVGWDAFWS